jgi:hypothetical protein
MVSFEGELGRLKKMRRNKRMTKTMMQTLSF